MGPILTKVLRENSSFMFTFMPWLFDLQYRLFMYFGPTRWLSRRLLTVLALVPPSSDRAKSCLDALKKYAPDVKPERGPRRRVPLSVPA